MKLILKTIQKALTNNWMLKIFAFVIASIVWLAVININDPTKTVTIYNVPITMVDEDVITSNNQIYSVQGNNHVNVTVSGRRSVVGNLNAGSFVAEASLKELSMTNSVPVTVTVKNSSISSKVTISKQSVSQILVDIENIQTKTYEVEKNIVGAVAQNYELGEVSLAKNKVDVTAPESVHNQIAKVIVNVDVDGVTADFSEKFKVVLMDSNGNKISKGDTVELSKSKVQVSVSVLKLIKVPLVVETIGTLPEGYEVTDVTTDPEEVTLAGPEAIVDEISEIKISGPDTDVTGMTSSVEKEINLINYLVSGVYIRGTSDVTLSIDIEGDIIKTFSFKPSGIELKDVASDYTALVTSSKIEITVSGKERDFDDITEESFKAAVSLKGAKEGKETVELEVTIPDGLKLEKKDKVKVKIEKKLQ